MNMIKISKLLDLLSYLGILGIIGYYIFLKPSTESLLICLLAVCMIRMIGSNLRANFYQKDYNKLKEDNEFMQRSLDEIKRKETEEEQINNK
ncbi:MAG: hypothetical protein WC679_05085 [Bacteroidales bacterium]